MDRHFEIMFGLAAVAGSVLTTARAILVLRVPERVYYWPLPRVWFPGWLVRNRSFTRWQARFDAAVSIFGAAVLSAIGIAFLVGD